MSDRTISMLNKRLSRFNRLSVEQIQENPALAFEIEYTIDALLEYEKSSPGINKPEGKNNWKQWRIFNLLSY